MGKVEDELREALIDVRDAERALSRAKERLKAARIKVAFQYRGTIASWDEDVPLKKQARAAGLRRSDGQDS